ncbi:MAG TPA: thioredoxin [Candidatus Methanofastidiosa archaeon]|nr:thioredoxin [Candidatus Methanofastidiosa archaeon]HPR41936.1 thioredoxin [Candidatus Methanofastidiosa archaeon]
MDDIEEIRKKKMEDMANKSDDFHPITATDDNFDKLLEDNPVLLVDFWAEWCMPCKMFAPTVTEFAKETQGKIAVAKLNVDEARNTAMRFNVMSIPTSMLFKEGKLVDKLTGAVSKQMLKQFVDRYV